MATLKCLFNPRSVAVIGASERPASLAQRYSERLLAATELQVSFVNPKHTQLFGQPCYAHVADLTTPPDLALICAPPASWPTLLAQLEQAGTAVAVLLSEQWADLPPTQQQRIQRSLEHTRQRRQIRLLGPQALWSAPSAGFAPGLACPPNGGVGIVCQQPDLAAAVLDWAADQGLGVHSALAVGTATVDIDLADLLDQLANDARCSVILLQLERVTQISRLLSAARAAAWRKPVLALRCIGDATLDLAYSAALARVGVLEIASLDQLERYISVLNVQPHAFDAAGLVVIGHGRGALELTRSALYRQALHLAALPQGLSESLAAPHNPLQLRPKPGQSWSECYRQALDTLLSCRGVRSIMLIHSAASFPAQHLVPVLVERYRYWQTQRSPIAPLLACFWSETARVRPELNAAGIIVAPTPEGLAHTFTLLEQLQHTRQRVQRFPQPWPEISAPWLEQPTLATLLPAYGIEAQPNAPSSGLTLRLHSVAEFGLILSAYDHYQCVLSTALLPLNDVWLEEWQARWPSPYWQRLPWLGELLQRLSLLLEQWPKLGELSLTLADTSTMAYQHGQLQWSPQPPAQPLAAYPSALQQRMVLPDGRILLLRAVRHTDALHWQRHFAQLNAEEVRLRFQQPLSEMSAAQAARLCLLDYARELALLLVPITWPQEPCDQFAVARLAHDVEGDDAEFAILVSHALVGLGLGAWLLRLLIEQARQRQRRRLYGRVLPDNHAMLKLAQALGFSQRPDPEEPALIRIERAL